MLERGQGRVVNVASILGDRGVPNCAVFSATQGAIVGFTKALGIEWIRQGVTVNALGVGFYEDVPGPQQDPALREILEKYIPVRRLGQAADLQGALVYLVSDEAGFIDSEVVVVDGAISVHA
jgi:gluconate 5-dehydrogenase